MNQSCIFVDNLSDDVINSDPKRLALLLSAKTTVKKLATYAKDYVNDSGILIIDNGNAKTIGDICKYYKSDAAKVCKSKDPKELLRLAYTILGHCTSECNDIDYFKEILGMQMAFSPTFFMCGENLLPQVLVELDLDRELLELEDRFFVDSQRDTIKLVKNVINGKYGDCTGEPFAVLHAVDYDTAYKVGQLAARSKAIQNIATGLSGFMNDQQTTDKYRFHGKWHPFTTRKAIYRKYFQSVAVSLGFIHGFHSAAGFIPRFHGLGIGAPFAILLLAYALRECSYFSVDSSAPSKNASMGKLYVSEPAYLTIPVENIAAGIGGKGKVWDCPCPHCTAFHKKYPIDYEKAKKAYDDLSKDKIFKHEDLKNDTPLGQALLFFSEPSDTKLRKEIKVARSGHNYWVLDSMMAKISDLKNDPDALDSWFMSEADKYMANASKIYAESIPEIMDFIAKAVDTRLEKRRELYRNE